MLRWQKQILRLCISTGWIWANLSFGSTLVESVSPFQFSIKDHLIVSSEQVEDADSTSQNLFMHESALLGEYGALTGRVHFSNRFVTDGKRIESEQPFVLEKKTIAGDWDHWSFAVGDSYHEFGKGIALSLYQDSNLGTNTTLEGLSVRYSRSPVTIGLLGGRVNPISNPVTLYPSEDLLGDNTLWLLGGDLKLKPSEHWDLGAHYFIALNAPPEKKIRRFDKYWNTVGAYVDRSQVFEDLDVYIEGNLLLPQKLVKEDFVEQPTGWGIYSAVVWTPIPWTVKVEMKEYRNYNFPFRRGPTLENELVTTTHENDVFATRFSIEHRTLPSQTTLRASFLVGQDRVVDTGLYHGILSAKFKAPAKVGIETAVGYRSLPGNSTMAHGNLKLKVPTLKRQYVELNLLKQYSRLNLSFLPETEDRNKVDLSYTFSSHWSGNLGYEYMPSGGEGGGPHFYNLGVEWRTAALTAKAFAGQTSGGTVCSSGVCRQVPPYSGAMVETHVAF